MKLKDSSVKVTQNSYTDAIKHAADLVYADFKLEPVCTSGNDSTHGTGSLHYEDRALDLRFWDILNVVRLRFKAILPPFYDVVVEKDHFHIEADKKKEAAWIKNSTSTSTGSSPVSKTSSIPSSKM